MAVKYQYLTDPLLGYQTKSGSLNTAGIIRVYDAATDDPVVTYKDFAGTANAQDIRLDDNGRAVIIADDSRAYRVEVCDRYGALLYTQTPLYAKGGGGGVMTGVNVISSDETVKVETTTEGGIKTFDLSVDKDDPEYIVCDSCYVKGYGNAGCGYIVPDHKVEGNMMIDYQGILLKGGQHYHIDAWIDVAADADRGDPSNEYRQREMKLNFRFASADGTPVNMVFDNSFPHSDTYNMSGDLHPAQDTYLKIYYDNYDWADYQSGYIIGGHLSMPRISVHSIVGTYYGGGGGGGGTGGLDRVWHDESLTGNGTEDLPLSVAPITLNMLSPELRPWVQSQADWSTNDSSDPSYIKNKPDMSHTVNVQSDWNVTDSTSDAYIKNKPDLSIYATKTELAGKENLLTAGSNIVINRSGDTTTISAISSGGSQVQSNWLETDNTDPSYIQNKPNLDDYQKKLTAGSNITINQLTNTISASQQQSDWNQINSADPTYIKNKPDLSQYATLTDLSRYQEKLTAGDRITINSSNVISASHVQSNWLETNTASDAYIQHKPVLTAGNNVTITTSGDIVTISSTGGGAGVQSNWLETDNTDPSYIQNKPQERNLVAGTNITLTEPGNNVTIAAVGNGGTVYTDGNMISLANDIVSVVTTAGITDVQVVNSLPASPVATVLYLIPET